jgi:penicillin-binding protein 1A
MPTGALARPRTPLSQRDLVLISTVLALLLTAAIVAAVWVGQHGLAIHRLTRGVGDTVFLGADGRPWFALDENRTDVPLDQIAPHFLNAVIAVEDHRFRYHPGVDPLGLGRALVENVRARGVSEGGSTITQQLARTLFLSNSRTYGRKFKEAVLALMMERRLTKDQILELYVNRIYLGAGVYGVEKMSRHLFSKPARQLSIAESALIAGLIQRPSSLSPWTNLDGARQRGRVVLQRMREERFITEEEEAAARSARLAIGAHPRTVRPEGAYAKEYLRQQFRRIVGGDHPPDWQVQTSFLPAAQLAAERAVAQGLGRLGRPQLQAALVAIRPDTGHIVALVGGRDFAQSAFDRATRSQRQPGSAFKPFLYAAALERGFSPLTLLAQPEHVPLGGDGEWRPRNVSDSSGASLPLRQALIESNNRAAVGVQQQMGSQAVLALARALGMPEMPDVPSLALGSGLVSPLRLTAAYAAFPNGGFAVVPHGMLAVTDDRGARVWAPSVARRRVLSEETAFQMVSLLTDVIDRGTGTAVRARGIRFPAGGKTGTTNDFRDAWFVGFSPSLVVGVWVGFDAPTSMGANASGAGYALPIWSDFMVRASRLIPPDTFAPPPAGLREHLLCSISYQRATTHCPTYREYLKAADVAPAEACRVHRGPTRVERARATVGRWLDRLKGIFR